MVRIQCHYLVDDCSSLVGAKLYSTYKIFGQVIYERPLGKACKSKTIGLPFFVFV